MHMFLFHLYNALHILLALLSWAMLIYCLLTWVAPRSSARFWLERFIEPVCAPFRGLALKLRARWGSPFDFTCLFAMIGIQLADYLLRVIFSILIF